MVSFRKWRDWLADVKVHVCTDHQELQYFNAKQKLNLQEPLWYLCMSEFIDHIHDRLKYEIGKPDALFRHLGKEKSRIDKHYFDEGQLLDLHRDEVGEKEDAEDVEVEGIDMDT